MRGLMRFLMMFGPMIFRQYQKYQSKKQREQQQNQRRIPQGNQQRQQPQGQANRDYSEAPKDGRYYKGRNEAPPTPSRKKHSPAKKTPPPISEEERNFNLKEEEFMLDPKTTADYKGELDALKQNSKMEHELPADDHLALDKSEPPQPQDRSTQSPIERKDEDDGFNIRELFLKPEDEDGTDV